MKTNKLQTGLVRNYLTATTVSALLSLTTYIGAATAQSADPKHPAPLQPDDNIAVISSTVQIPQYYYVTLGPGKGTLTVEFSANGFPGAGGEIRVSLLKKGSNKNYSVAVKSTKAVFGSDAAQTGQVTIPFDVKQASQVILRIDPPSSGLIVAAGRYNIKATGAVKFAPIDSSQAQVVGTYRVHSYILGDNESNKLIKLMADGKILSETGSTGSWSLFDPSSKTYVLELASKRSTLIFWPAVGFSAESTGNPDLQLVR
ncbi:hypothetical protein [Nostoc sp.]|uniref:hypothetical protein n=1 Tax=Nostoc sp. TaxID=1180 RepID=UPI002FF839E9